MTFRGTAALREGLNLYVKNFLFFFRVNFITYVQKLAHRVSFISVIS